jgi:hypothetical protein
VTGILSLLLPVFAVIGLGRAAVAAKLLDTAAVKSLNDFALWVALPALMFRSMAEATTLQVTGIAGVYLAGCLIVYLAAGLIARFVLRRGLAEAAVFALNATYGNIIYLGTPVIAAAFGPPGVAVVVGIIALHSGVLLPLTSALIEFGGHGAGGIAASLRKALSGMARNSILMSILLGAVWHTIGAPVPHMIEALLSMLGAAAPPLALFCVGASLPTLARERALGEALTLIVLKLFVMPPVIGALAYAAGLSGLPLTVAVIAAAMPTGANAFLLSRRAAGFVQASASAVVVTTVLSVATLSSLLLWMH